jgi:NADH-quinone oxidoreductase subunit I
VVRLVDSIRPLIAGIKHIFWRRLTIKYPDQMLVLPERERGRHVLLLENCIGCGICERICPTLAIRLVQVDKAYSPKNRRNCYPSCNFGRCCFCDLCIESCPSQAFVHTSFFELSTAVKDTLKLSPTGFAEQPRSKGWRKKHQNKAMRLSWSGAYHA